MHIKGKGRAEGTQILCQGHGKGKARRVSTLDIPWREVPKRDKGLVTTSSSCRSCAPRSRSGPCPWTEDEVAAVRGVGRTWTPGYPAGMGAYDFLLSPSSIHLAAREQGVSFPPRCESGTGSRTNNGPAITTSQILTP